jgi:hypothetical protein
MCKPQLWRQQKNLTPRVLFIYHLRRVSSRRLQRVSACPRLSQLLTRPLTPTDPLGPRVDS